MINGPSNSVNICLGDTPTKETSPLCDYVHDPHTLEYTLDTTNLPINM